ncbi:hypothetical protein [Roseateles sp. MS654]|uniref:hypothetical protein n=1 Tax=Roseateles sp. MS654 TaxID=3412685 RepID=UPI003C2DD605
MLSHISFGLSGSFGSLSPEASAEPGELRPVVAATAEEVDQKKRALMAVRSWDIRRQRTSGKQHEGTIGTVKLIGHVPKETLLADIAAMRHLAEWLAQVNSAEKFGRWCERWREQEAQLSETVPDSPAVQVPGWRGRHCQLMAGEMRDEALKVLGGGAILAPPSSDGTCFERLESQRMGSPRADSKRMGAPQVGSHRVVDRSLEYCEDEGAIAYPPELRPMGRAPVSSSAVPTPSSFLGEQLDILKKRIELITQMSKLLSCVDQHAQDAIDDAQASWLQARSLLDRRQEAECLKRSKECERHCDTAKASLWDLEQLQSARVSLAASSLPGASRTDVNALPNPAAPSAPENR